MSHNNNKNINKSIHLIINIFFVFSQLAYLVQEAESARFLNLGTHCGSLNPTEVNKLNLGGIVWALDDHTLLIDQFSYTPSFSRPGNVTFWFGPDKFQTSADAFEQNQMNFFPSDNGFYVSAKEFTFPPIDPTAPVSLIARTPTKEEKAQIKLKLGASSNRKTQQPQPQQPDAPAPEPEPEPAYRQRRRAKRQTPDFDVCLFPKLLYGRQGSLERTRTGVVSGNNNNNNNNNNDNQGLQPARAISSAASRSSRTGRYNSNYQQNQRRTQQSSSYNQQQQYSTNQQQQQQQQYSTNQQQQQQQQYSTNQQQQQQQQQQQKQQQQQHNSAYGPSASGSIKSNSVNNNTNIYGGSPAASVSTYGDIDLAQLGGVLPSVGRMHQFLPYLASLQQQQSSTATGGQQSPASTASATNLDTSATQFQQTNPNYQQSNSGRQQQISITNAGRNLQQNTGVARPSYYRYGSTNNGNNNRNEGTQTQGQNYGQNTGQLQPVSASTRRNPAQTYRSNANINSNNNNNPSLATVRSNNNNIGNQRYSSIGQVSASNNNPASALFGSATNLNGALSLLQNGNIWNRLQQNPELARSLLSKPSVQAMIRGNPAIQQLISQNPVAASLLRTYSNSNSNSNTAANVNVNQANSRQAVQRTVNTVQQGSSAGQQQQTVPSGSLQSASSAQLYNYYANLYGGGGGAAAANNPNDYNQNSRQQIANGNGNANFGNDLIGSTGNSLWNALSKHWIPSLLGAASENLPKNQPVSISVFDLKGLRKLWNPDTTTTIPLSLQASNESVSSTSTLTTTTTTSSSNILSTKNPDGKGDMIELIVQGGSIRVPATKITTDANSVTLTQSSSFANKQKDVGITNDGSTRVINRNQPVSINLESSGGKIVRNRNPIVIDNSQPRQTSSISSNQQPSSVVPMKPLVFHAAHYPPLELKLPKGRRLQEVKWISVWDHDRNKPLGQLLMPHGPAFKIPQPEFIDGFRPFIAQVKDVRSGPIEIVDSKTIKIHDFVFEGDAPGAWLMAGKGVIPLPTEHILPIQRSNGSYDCSFLKAHYKETITVKLPGDLEVHEIHWLSVLCVPYSIVFSNVYIPYKDLHVPPSLDGHLIPKCIFES